MTASPGRRAGLALALWLCSTLAHAHPEVDGARSAYLEGDFVGALSRLEAAERSPSATESDRVNIHWYRAASCHALGRQADAAAAMDALLALRPLFVPSRAEAPPDLRAALAERQRLYQEAHGVTLGDAQLLGPGVRVPLLGHPENVGRVVAFVRVAPEVDYTPVMLQVDNAVAEGELPLGVWQRAAQQGRLDVVFEAQNARGALTARAGDALTPLSLTVPPDVAQRALAALQNVPLTQARPAPVTPPATTDIPVKTAPPPPTVRSPYRFGFPPWFFVLLTTGVVTACGGFSLGACSLTGPLALALIVNGNDTFQGIAVLPGIVTILTLLMGSLFCCSALPLSGCTGILWVADFFYVAPQARTLETAAPQEEELSP